MIRTTAFLLLSLSLAPAAIAAEVEFKNPDSFKQLNLPFSEAVRVDDLLFLSGQLGNKPGGLGLVEGGIGPETKQTMENIKNVLIRNKLGLDRDVKCTMFLDDIDAFHQHFVIQLINTDDGTAAALVLACDDDYVVAFFNSVHACSAYYAATLRGPQVPEKQSS